MIETPHATFHLDSPAPGEPSTEGRTILRGWIVAKPGQHFIDLRARVGQYAYHALLGFPRPDLAEYFRTREPRLLAAFEQPVVLAAGQNSVVFEACTLAGEWIVVHTEVVSAGPAPVEPASARPASAASPAPLRALEFARAFHLLLRRAADEEHPDWSTLATEIATALPRPATARFAHAPFHSHFDEPAAITRGPYGRIHLVGGIFHETEPIQRVHATFDLQTTQELRPTGRYSDLAARFPQYRNAANCRWEGYIDCPAQLPQPRTLRLYAELANGSWHLCNVQHTLLWDIETEKRGYPRFSHRSFLGAVWALHRALRHRGVALGNLRTLLPELRPVWRSFRALAPRRGPSMGGISGELFTTDPTQSDLHHVLLVSHNLNLEGAPLFLAEFAAYCRRNTHARLTVVTGRDGPLRRRYEQLGATIHVVDHTPLDHAATPAAQRTALRRIVATLDFAACDLVVANTLASYWAVHAAHAAHRPSLFYIHESTTPAAFFHGRHPAALPGIEQALAAATRVSFLTAATRRYYTAFSDGANYRITPGWIDLRSLDAVRSSRTREELRHRLALAPDERLVLNLGTVCDRKGQILFARAVDLLCRRYAPAEKVRFLMVGARDTDYDRDLAAQLKTLDRPNLSVVPECEDAPAFYGAADLFVCSSFEESFPRVILEAMAFSLPIVSSAVHGVPEIVRHDEEAILVPPGDTWSLAEALQQILEQPAWARQLGQRARRRLEQTFTTERVQPLHLALARETATVQS